MKFWEKKKLNKKLNKNNKKQKFEPPYQIALNVNAVGEKYYSISYPENADPHNNADILCEMIKSIMFNFEDDILKIITNRQDTTIKIIFQKWHNIINDDSNDAIVRNPLQIDF